MRISVFSVVFSMVTGVAFAQPLPRKADIGTDRWGREVGEALKLIRASMEVGDIPELRRQGIRASRLAGEAASWPEQGPWKSARVHCSRTAQALSNIVDDVQKGTARGKVSAEAELKVMMEASSECASRLDRIK